MNCPNYETLAHAAFADPVPPETAHHLEHGCSACSPRWALLRKMREAFLAGELRAVPASLRQVARQVGAVSKPGGREARRSLLSTVKLLVAELIPPPAGSLMPAVRRASVREVRKLYRADSFEIDLLLTPERTLMGQVITSSDASLVDAWCTLSTPSGEARVALRDTGEFTFEGVKPGVASLDFELRKIRILIQSMDLPG